jgi:mono/diheme cytochrome c family protein
MGFYGRGFYSLLLVWAVLFPFALAAEAQQSSSAASNEQQTKGRILYNQNCRLCHTPEAERAKDPTPGKSVGPSLVGLFSPPRSRPEVVVRTFIMQGVPEKMPAFRYGLQPAEVDAIIAYLKTL